MVVHIEPLGVVIVITAFTSHDPVAGSHDVGPLITGEVGTVVSTIFTVLVTVIALFHDESVTS